MEESTVAGIIELLFVMVENIVGKRENVCY